MTFVASEFQILFFSVYYGHREQDGVLITLINNNRTHQVLIVLFHINCSQKYGTNSVANRMMSKFSNLSKGRAMIKRILIIIILLVSTHTPLVLFAHKMRNRVFVTARVVIGFVDNFRC